MTPSPLPAGTIRRPSDIARVQRDIEATRAFLDALDNAPDRVSDRDEARDRGEA